MGRPSVSRASAARRPSSRPATSSPWSGPTQTAERARHVVQPTERAVRAGHRQDHRHVGREPQGGARRGAVDRLSELRADGDAGHDDALLRNAARDVLVAHLGGGDAVAVDVGRDPLVVRDEVGDDRRVRRHPVRQPGERRHRRGRRGVNGDDGVRRQPLEQGGQPAGAQPGHAERQARVAGQPVAERVPGAPQEGRAPEQPVIERPAQAIEHRVDQLTEMIHDRDGGPRALEGVAETAGGCVVARAVAGSEDQNAGHRPASSYLVSRAEAG